MLRLNGLLAALFFVVGAASATAQTEDVAERRPVRPDVVLDWNAIALDANLVDHSRRGVPKEQGGPTRSARALAMVHVAMFDAANSITGDYASYLIRVPLASKASLPVAVSQAAHDVLVSLYPSQKATFDAALAVALGNEPNAASRAQGQFVGTSVALTVLSNRNGDGSTTSMVYVPGREPGQHRPDPLNPNQGFNEPNWGRVKPFAISAASAFRSPPPPALSSREYARAFDEVKSEGQQVSTTRSKNETEIGIYWAYDGTIGLGTPQRLYNQMVRVIAEKRRNTVMENARLFALVNLAMADAGIACWESKYHYNYWRPVVGIRESDPGTGPTKRGDGNSRTVGDPSWRPLGAPGSNRTGPDFSPPFPAYPSGHATFGAAAFQMVQRFYGTNNINFEFVSDEYNGVTTDSVGRVRPRVSRRFGSLNQAMRENSDSRIYLGVHWSFDATAGERMGTSIANDIFHNDLRPLRRNGNAR